MATAPQAIYDVFALIQQGIPSAELGGIVGDMSHSFGYHLSRNELPSTDYSVQLGLDQGGDPGTASALDIDFGPELMITVTNRLLRAAQERDPRMAGVREFCGTTDGVNTHPFDLSNRQDGPLNSWDASHLWHVHISFYRAYAEDYDAIKGVASVITGGESGLTETAVPIPAVKPPLLEDQMFTALHRPDGWVFFIAPGYAKHVSPDEFKYAKARGLIKDNKVWQVSASEATLLTGLALGGSK